MKELNFGTIPRNHNEQGIIDVLRDRGLIVERPGNGLWFDPIVERAFDESLTLSIIEEKINALQPAIQAIAVSITRIEMTLSKLGIEYDCYLNNLNNQINNGYQNGKNGN